MTKINISIPKPCHENWQAMTPENKGRFCASCQKKVFDFTSSSDREIINAFEQNNNLCGRFLNTQLDRDLIKPKEKSTIWLATTTALISLIGLNDAVSQEKAPTEQTDNFELGKFMTPAPTPAISEEIEVSGIVSDFYNNKTLPLNGVTVKIKGTEIATQTDSEGKYKIKAKKGDILIFSYFGLNDKQILVEKSKENSAVLEYDITFDQTSSIMLGGITYKRTFFGRIFHAVGNLFR